MIKFLDLQAITAKYQDEIHNALKRTVDSGWYLLGKETELFEKAYAEYIGVQHCVGCANGLDAIHLMFKALIQLGRLHKGDEILVSANTFIATIHGITENGLRPIFVDARDDNGQLDEALLSRLITNKTRAVFIVHLYGQCALTQGIEEFCKTNNLLLLEDNAQAHGCRYGMKRTGSLGFAAAHSFYPGKNLGALGDGGAVTTNDAELAATIRQLGNYGYSRKYVCDSMGRNSRLDELQAAVLRVKLAHLDDDIAARQAVARYYYEHIANPLIQLPTVGEQGTHVYHLFPIRCKQRDKLQKYLAEKGIETLIHYPIPPHKQLCYNEYQHLTLPITELISNEELSLPISQVMTISDAENVVTALNEFS